MTENIQTSGLTICRNCSESLLLTFGTRHPCVKCRYLKCMVGNNYWCNNYKPLTKTDAHQAVLTLQESG